MEESPMKNGNGKAAPRKHFGGGIYLQTSESGSASWLLRYQRNGKEVWLGLGSKTSKTKGISLNKARDRARAAQDQIFEGVDPLKAKQDKRAQDALEASRSITFAECAKQYYAKHEKSWTSQKHRQAFLNTLQQHAYPVIGTKMVSAVDSAMVLKILEPIWIEKHQTASRVRARIESVLNWAAAPARKYRSGDNPAAWGLLKHDLPTGGEIGKVVNHPALPYSDVPAFVQQLSQHQGIGPKALEFIILAAARTSEVLGARWDEFDFDKKTWTIPGPRMKGRKTHVVPLTGRMIELLPPREAGNDLVFIGTKANRPLGKMTLPKLVDAMKYDVTIHGFRASFKTWAGEISRFTNEAIEFSLAHVVGSGAEQAYWRGDMIDKRRQLMEAWGRFVSTPRQIGVKEATPIRKVVN
jgi:integrase